VTPPQPPRTETPKTDRALIARLWRDWLRPYRLRLGLNLLVIAVFAGANALYPEIIRRSVDALKIGDTGLLAVVAPAIILATLVKGLALYTHKVLTNGVLARVETDIQQALFRHLVRADLSWLSREAPASFAARFTSDVGLMRLAMERLVTSLLRDLLSVIGLMIALFWIDWELALIATIGFPLVILPIAAIGRRLRKLSRRASEQVSAMTAGVAESLAAVRIVKTYRLEEYLTVRADNAFNALRKLKVRAVRSQAGIDPIMELLAGFTVAGLIWIIGQRIAAGTNTLGDITGFIAALLLAAQPLKALSNLNATVQTGLAGGRRVVDVLDTPALVVDRPGARDLAVRTGAVDFDRVTFRYGEDEPAVEDFTLSVPGGARVALVGRSGAGKSTLFNLLPRLYDVTSGAVRIDGQDIRDVTLASLRDKVALVGQEALLFNDSVRANIAFGRPGASRAEIEAAARAAAAHDFIMALPGGYDAEVGERGDRLSGGQRQRVAIARAFLRDAPILLLDEPTSALDAESETAVRDALRRLSAGRTTLIIAHRLSTILDADLIAVLDGGRLVELGRHAELVAGDGLYAHLHRLQFHGETAA
jgi:subfamily B ATP-binding cassette protein MsbA